MRLPDWRGQVNTWAPELIRVLNAALSELRASKLTVGDIYRAPAYRSTELPPATRDGQIIFITDEGRVAFAQGGSWRRLRLKGEGGATAELGTRENPAKNGTELADQPSGYYWIQPPASPAPYYTYIDNSVHGGGWMLLMNIPDTTSDHVITNNAVGLAAVDGNNGVAEYQSAPTVMSRHSRATINEFLAQDGMKVMWVRPTAADQTAISSPGWWNSGNQNPLDWGANLECSNRGSIPAWLLGCYYSYSDAINQVNFDGGTYTNGGYYYPTSYGSAQNFFRGNAAGIRFASGQTSGTLNHLPGHLFLKVA